MYMGSSIEFALGLPLGLRSSAHMSFACRVPDLSSPPTDTPSTAAWKRRRLEVAGVAVFSATPFTGYGECGRKAIVKASGGAADGDLGESPPPASAATASSSSWEGRAACTKYVRIVCMYRNTAPCTHMFVCLSVCLCVCLFVVRMVCTHVHTHPCVRVCIVFTYVCMHTRMYVCTHVLCSFARHVCACMCVFLHGPTSGTRRTSGVIVVRMAGCYVLVLWSMFSGGGAWAFKVWEIV